MPDPPPFDADSVREAWDRGAGSYARGQASGRDRYRYEFFGPAHVEACGDVAGLDLLDVGCGSGYFAREMAKRRARVTAVDISPRMIEQALRIERAEPMGIEYRVLDAARCGSALFEPDSFDVATSCVALQDMSDPPQVFLGVHALLKPGGRFIASILHPCTNTPFREWERDAERRKRWLCIDRYFERGAVTCAWDWDEHFVTQFRHATLEDWLGWMLGAGFRLRTLLEPKPTEAALRTSPDLEDARRVPYFLIVDLRRDMGAPG